MDRNPLGNVTAPPLECGAVSRQAIGRAIGMDNFYASGSMSPARFSHCVVATSPGLSDKASMTIELHDPSPSTVESLEYTKTKDGGADLPVDTAPGYSATTRDTGGAVVGGKAMAWTQDGKKLLVIQIVRGAPGRDHRADAVEFIRGLRPLLLT
ncbi:hypothetical protein ACIBKY_21825 [Nonomuraea sp. NPDC050394]|uniref:hypothetical protein n=1 Tax=Nonomuraea sp. NPDC050394 TaxID=3364363 RepID=UPI00378821FA